jgi:hypothetical protein
MAITDAERHRLHTKLDEVLGEEDAAVLISHLPPSGWSDVARTRDLDQLELRLEGQIARLDGRIDRLEAEMEHGFALVDERFNRVDERFNTMEARFDASLQRTLRTETIRFLGATAAIVTVVATVQGLVLSIVGG